MESEENVIFIHSGEDMIDEKLDENEQVSFSNNGQIESPETLYSWPCICRVCAKSDDYIIPIFEAEGVEHELIDKIHKYLPIQVDKTDTLPIQLCYHCAATILAWDELLTGCLDAQKQLLKMQSDQNFIDSTKTKYTENVMSELVDNLEPITMAKQESSSTSQQDEETEHCDLKEGLIKRLHDCSQDFSENLDAIAIKSETIVKVEKDFTSVNNAVDKKMYNRERSKIMQDKEDLVKTKASMSSETKIRRKTIKKKKEIINDPYVCDLCGKKFRLRFRLKSHLLVHTGMKYFVCHICGKQFAQNGCLYYHLRHVHDGVKNHTCNICGRSFAMKKTMEDHLRSIHTGERPFICHSCGKTFTTKSSLYAHSKIHIQHYPHECNYCKKSFKWKQKLIAHMMIHTGEKNHTCNLCGKSFSIKYNLERHKLTHETKKPYSCEVCGMKFGQKRYLTTHEKLKH